MKKFSLLIATLFAFSPLAANAAALFTSTSTPAGNRAALGGTVGTQFTVGLSDLLVTSLGYEDAGLNGLAVSHQVGIWTSAGALVASGTIAAGIGAPLIDAWRYATLGTPVTLSAGQTYRIGGHAAGDNFTDSTFPGGTGINFAIAGEAAFSNANRFEIGGVLAEPVRDGTGTLGRWAGGNATFIETEPPVAGGDFKITSIAINSVTDTLTLIWNSIPGEKYAIDFSQDLAGWPGLFAASVDASAGRETVQFTSPQANFPPGSRFFVQLSVLGSRE